MMKTSIFPILAIVLSGSLAFAAAPEKAPLTKYTTLWSNSPFTTKPPPPTAKEEDSALADWTLGGVSAVEGGYMITLHHKKNAGESQIIRPRGVQKIFPDKIEWLAPGAPGTFKLERVERGKGGWKGTEVHLLAGAKSGVVRFDEKNLVPKASAPAQGRQGQQPGQPGQQPGQPGAQPAPGQQPNQAAPGGGRQPRQRVLPPTPAPAQR
jgi:hypothetical protein